MKKTFKTINILLTLALLLPGSVLLSQNCERAVDCDENIGEGFMYKSQSRYGTLPLGEKKRVKTALFSGKRYRIFVGAEEGIGEVAYKVIRPVRKNITQVKEVKHDTVVQYKTDEWGEIMYPEENNYEPVEIGREVFTDTIMETIRITEEKILFDSKKNSTGNNYWEKSIKGRGFSVILEVETPPGDPDIEECVNLYVGSKSLSKKRMGGYGKQSLWD